METETFEIQNEFAVFDLQSHSTYETKTPKQKM